MTAQQSFDDVADAMQARGARVGNVFGKIALLSETKAFACLHDSRFAVKLGAGSREHMEALALSGAELFDPSGKHRPFKDWVSIPAEHSDSWLRYAEAAATALP